MEKKTLILAILLIVSIALNIVLFINIGSSQQDAEKKYSETLAKNEEIIASLNAKIEDLKQSEECKSPDERKNTSKTKLEIQDEYKNIATQFITSYLEYDTSNLEERRNDLLKVTNEKLINRIAPKPIENQENQLSSDPTFTANIEKLDIFITSIDEDTGVSRVIADVQYETKSTEGEASVRSLIQLKMEKEDASIKVQSYDYYPIN